MRCDRTPVAARAGIKSDKSDKSDSSDPSDRARPPGSVPRSPCTNRAKSPDIIRGRLTNVYSTT